MKLSTAIYAFLPALTLSQGLNEICYNGQDYGICQYTSWCSDNGGWTEKNFCPDAGNDVLCCFGPSCDGGKGNCDYTGDPSGECNNGTGEFVWVTGYCPGPSDYKCCT